MSFLSREKALATCAAAGTFLIAVWLGVRGAGLADWNVEARPAVDALLAGHAQKFLELSPIYGASLILRAPFMLSTELWHGGNAAIYLASAAPCIAATAALGVWLSAQMHQRGASLLACAAAILLAAGSPLAIPALQLGHPEDLLGAVLCITAVLCALKERPVWAAVLLGVAIANKEWAVLAVGPMLVALPHTRVRALLITGAVAASLLAPLLFRTSGGFVAQASSSGLNTGTIFQPWQWWWFLGTRGHIVYNVIGGYRLPPAWVASLGHTLVIAIMLPLSALYAWVQRKQSRRSPNDVLLLLALMLALRCVLDPWDISYYSLPFLLTLLTWESLRARPSPALTAAASFAAWLVFRGTGTGALDLSPDTQALMFALVSVPAIVALTVAVYAPGIAAVARERAAARLRPRSDRWVPTPTPEAEVGT